MNVDIVQPGDDLSGYKLVLAPHLHVLADDVANQLVEYVRNGGVLLADCRTASRTKPIWPTSARCRACSRPRWASKSRSTNRCAWASQTKTKSTYKISADGDWAASYTAIRYADWIKPTGANRSRGTINPISSRTPPSRGTNSATGVGWYVGTIVDEPEFYDKLIAQLLDDADIQPLVEPPPGVEVSVRSNEIARLLFVINHTDEAATVNVPSGQQELLSKTMTGETLTLDGFGVAVIELPAAEGAARK